MMSTLRVKIALFLLGPTNRASLDEMMCVICGTKRNYEIKREAPILLALMRRWLDSEDGK
jgi:hypothetical protein